MAMSFFILGLMNHCSHDPGACLLEVAASGEVIRYIFAEEGFLSRRKKSYQFPLRSIKYCLDYFQIGIQRLDCICMDYMDNKRLHRTSDNYRLLVGDYMRTRLRIGESTKILFCESHHTAHAYSTFCASPFDKAAILVIDGLGSRQETHSMFKGCLNEVSHIVSQKGTGIGELYTLVTERLGFDVGEEGKTMGLAGYGAINQSQISNNELKGTRMGTCCDYTHILRRHPSPALKLEISKITNKDHLYRREATDLAFKVQRECEDSVVYLARECIKISADNNICYAGGVALNCVANERLSELYGDRLFIQPAAGDTGIPIGLALYAAHRITGTLPRINRIGPSNCGRFYPYSTDKTNTINKSLERFLGITEDEITKDISVTYSVEKVVTMLKNNMVGAIYSEGIEIGPRALGHRSFIANAKSKDMKEVMNRKIKHREAYRPFAPIVLSCDYEKYFDGSISSIHSYMLGAPVCTERAREEVPSIVHVDNTARVQAVEESAGRIHNILEHFKKATGTSVLINTSFNDNNEPIVFTYLDALICFLRTNCDFLILNDKLILRSMIADTLCELKKFTKMQEDWIRYFSEQAINELTTIGSGGSEDIVRFMYFNLKLTESNTQWGLVLRLLQFLDQCCSQSGNILYTDMYHLGIIKVIDNLFPSSEILKKLNVEQVDDELASLSMIRQCDDAYYLLYNLSIWMNCSKTVFYRSSDKILQQNLGLNRPAEPEKDMDYIMQSYEVKTGASIGEWFELISGIMP